jgi:hypothetical protein
MRKINLKSFSDQELLDLLSNVKLELNLRFTDILYSYLKKYSEEHESDTFKTVDLTKLEKDVQEDLGVDKDKLHEGMKLLSSLKKMYVSIIPGRELRMIKFYFR